MMCRDRGIRIKRETDLNRKKRKTKSSSDVKDRIRITGTAFLAVMTAGIGILSGCSTGSTEPEYILTYAENQNEDYPTTKGALYFSEMVEKRTDGRIRIRVYSDGQLGSEEDIVKQLTFGGVDMMRASDAILADYSELAMVIMMPYLYRSSEHMWAVLDGEIGDEVKDSFADSGLCALSWYDAGVRCFYTVDPVDSLEDLQGLKIRVQNSQLVKDMITSLGAEPVALDYGEVYSAIEQGEVDGAENNWPSYVSMDHYRIAPYFLLDEHLRIPELQLISADTMNRLSETDQNILRECAEESALYERKLWAETEVNAREDALQGGATETQLSDEEKQKFRDAVEPLYQKYCGDHMDLVERIRNTEEEDN